MLCWMEVTILGVPVWYLSQVLCLDFVKLCVTYQFPSARGSVGFLVTEVV